MIYHFADVCEIANETSSPLSSPDSPPSTIPTPPLYFSDAEIPSKVKNLAKAMAPYLVRPRVVTALTMTDKHPTLVVQDLILYHEQVFTGIDARTNRAHAARRRSASGSEANRRFNIEERNKAIVAAAQKRRGSWNDTFSEYVQNIGTQQQTIFTGIIAQWLCIQFHFWLCA